MDAQFFIHIGLPKTGTTFLQQNVFPRIENVEFLGKAKCLDLYPLYTTTKRKFLVSHEHLLACPSETYEGGWLKEFTARLQDLARRFPTAKIILSFRSHESLLTSYYKEYISKPGRAYLTRDQFFDVENNDGLVRHEDLAFTHLIDLVQRHFHERPFVFLFEDVTRQLPAFLDDLSAYMGETMPSASEIPQGRVNPGVGYYQAKLLVRLNRFDARLRVLPFSPSLYNPAFKALSLEPDRLCRKHLAFLSKRPLALTEKQRSFINEHYRRDWEQTLEYVSNQRHELNARELDEARAETTI